jgi:hypothetical protein
MAAIIKLVRLASADLQLQDSEMPGLMLHCVLNKECCPLRASLI